jgi:putative flippase GtrA
VISGPYALSVAQTLSFSLGLIVSFTGSRLFTFNNKDATYTHSVTRQIGSYVVLAVTNLVITNVVIYGLVHYLALMPFVAKVLVMCMVVVWNFLIFQKIIFKSK